MAEQKNLYDILGVARDAEFDEIRKSYRKLARQNHPDLNPGDTAAEERFKEISRAWEVLQDEERRKNYDEFGEVSLEAGFDAEKARQARESFGQHFGFGQGFRPGGTGGAGGGHPFGGPHAGRGGAEFEFGDIDDLLGGLFGRGGDPRGMRGMQMQGADLEASLELDFLEAIRGGEKRLTLGRPDASGNVVQETVTVRIPPGVTDSGRLRLAGKGGPGAGGGPPGDLYVRLQIRPHAFFKRDGSNLEIELPVSVREATNGAEIEVPTLDGKVTLKIPAGTDSGARLRLRGKGVPGKQGAAAGDLFVRVQIRVPKGLDDEARAALDALESFEDPAIRSTLDEASS